MKSIVLKFGEALEVLKAGGTVTRAAWGGAVDGIFLVQGSKFTVSRAPLIEFFPAGAEVQYRQHIDVRRGNVVGVWSPTSEDILANDWMVV